MKKELVYEIPAALSGVFLCLVFENIIQFKIGAAIGLAIIGLMIYVLSIVIINHFSDLNKNYKTEETPVQEIETTPVQENQSISETNHESETETEVDLETDQKQTEELDVPQHPKLWKHLAAVRDIDFYGTILNKGTVLEIRIIDKDHYLVILYTQDPTEDPEVQYKIAVPVTKVVSLIELHLLKEVKTLTQEEFYKILVSEFKEITNSSEKMSKTYSEFLIRHSEYQSPNETQILYVIQDIIRNL